jgi:hypothetical protein
VLGQRRVWSGTDAGDQRRLDVPSDPPPPPRSKGSGDGAGLMPPLSPPRDGAHADAEEAGRLGLGETGVNGSQQPLAEVSRVLLHPHSFPPAQLLRNTL